MNLDVELRAMENRVAELTDWLAEARHKLNEIKKAIAARDYGVNVGDIVIARSGVEARVAEIVAEHGGKPWLIVSKRNKSGEFSKARMNIYSYWTKP